jgi:Flp pilus assembly pilin Flp
VQQTGDKNQNAQCHVGRIKRLAGDERGQAMTEYVILVSVAVAIAAWLYFPDNGIYQGFRHIFNKTSLILGWPGP